MMYANVFSISADATTEKTRCDRHTLSTESEQTLAIDGKELDGTGGIGLMQAEERNLEISLRDLKGVQCFSKQTNMVVHSAAQRK